MSGLLLKMVIERLKWWLFVEDFVGWIEGWRRAAGCASCCKAFDLPGGKVDIIFFIIFVAAKVEGDFDFFANAELVDQFDLIFNTLELNVLWVFVSFVGDDEFALIKAAGKGLFLENYFYGSR